MSDTRGSAFENMPSFLIATLGNRMSVLVERHIRRELDLGFTEWRVVQIVGSEAGASAGRITAVTGVNKANISRAVSLLEERGMIHRTAEEGHARRFRFFLTEAGKACFERGNDLRRVGEQQLLEGLDSADRDAFCAYMRKMMRNLDQISDFGSATGTATNNGKDNNGEERP